MKESRLMIIVFGSLLFTLGPILYLLYLVYPDLIDYMNVGTNLYCGIIVGLITSICQYCSSKRKIINSIYGLYFDLYRSYYYSNNKAFLLHYNSYSIFKKIIELNPKIIEALDEYHGLFKRYDSTYRELNPAIYLGESYKAKNMLKSFFLWFNKKSFNYYFKPLMKEIESILSNINKKRFEKDKEEMVRMYSFLWSKQNEK